MSVQLLLEFAAVHHNSFSKPSILFKEFAESLFSGTINEFTDPSNLWWSPRRPEDASRIINHLTNFSDWLGRIREDEGAQLNPWRKATYHEERMNWAAYSHRRDNAFLSHLWGQNRRQQESRTVRSITLPIERLTPAKTFQDSKFKDLLQTGFFKSSLNHYDCAQLRNVLITILMHYGGLRLSEALSLWVQDVTFENGETVVRIYHPEHGTTEDGRLRSAYLMERYGLQPRNSLVKSTDPLFLGWKNCLITDPERNCFEVIFYPQIMGKYFSKLWLDYQLLQRTAPKEGHDHPYAFTNKYGQPYSHRMFRKAHKKAILRIGLEYGKLQGTTPHGHRHAYGQRLAQDGASALLIKISMHHKSIESAAIYTQPTAKQVRNCIKEMEERLLNRYGEDVFDSEESADGEA